MSENHRLLDYLDHIQQAATDACGFVEGLAKEDFLEDKRTQQAVIMSLIIITGVASTLQNEQISRIRVCIPKGTSSNDVVQKVVWYLREKADADDMKVAAVSLIGPLLPVLYNCTPGKPPPRAHRGHQRHALVRPAAPAGSGIAAHGASAVAGRV